MTKIVSLYSFLSAVASFIIALVLVYVLHKCTGHLKKYGISVLLFACALALLRLLLPLDLPFAHLWESWEFLPSIRARFQDEKSLLLTIWWIGSAGILISDICGLASAYAECRDYIVIENPQVDRIAERLSVDCPVVVSPDVSDPFVAGLFKHTIYLSDREQSDMEIELALKHETQHIKSHDSQIKLLWGLLSAVFWWTIAACLFRWELDALLELRCDANVTKSMNESVRLQYVDMLTKMAKRIAKRAKRPRFLWYVSGALKSPSAIEERIRVLLDDTPQSNGHAAKGFLIVLFLASYLVIWQPAVYPTFEGGEFLASLESDVIEDNLAKTIETAFISRREGRYYLFIDGKETGELSLAEVNSDLYRDYIILEEYTP